MTAIPTISTALTAFAAAGGPVMLAVAALGLLVGVLGTASDNTEKYKNKAKELTSTEEENKNAVTELQESYEQLDSRRSKLLEGINSEAEHNRALFTELQSITNENGKVQEGYEERAEFILGELSTALGKEYELTGNQIENYKEMTESIEKLIQQKQAEALLNADTEKYTEAIKNQTSAFIDYKAAQENVNSAHIKLTEAQNAETRAQEDLSKALQNSMWMHEGIDPKIEMARKTLEAAKGTTQGYAEKLEEMQTTLKNAEDVYVGYNTTIQNHEGLSAAIIAGDQEKISGSLERLVNNFQTADTGTKESLERQTTNLQVQLASMQEAVNSGAPGITQAQVDNMAELVIKSAEELNKLPGAIEEPHRNLFTSLNNIKDKLVTFGKGIGTDYTAGYAGGVKEGLGSVNNAVSDMAESSLNKTKEVLDSHSPSKKTHQIGLDYDAGFAGGITEGTNQVTMAVKSVTENSLSTLTTNLQQSEVKTREFQTNLSTAWGTWSTGLSSTLSNTFAGISTETNTKLNTIKTAFDNATASIKTNWQTKWKDIQTDYARVTKEIEKLTKDTLAELKTVTNKENTEIKTDTLKIMEELVKGIDLQLKNLKPTIESNFKPAMDYIQDLIPKARVWGNDMMDGYMQGIREKIKELEKTVEKVANTVSDYMHFTRPEKGPLRNYEEWMPHMMQGLSAGIQSNKYLITEQIEDLANSMSLANNKQTIRANLFNQVVLDGKVIFDAFNELAGEAL